MVRDDEIQSQGSGVRHFGRGTNATIHSDDQSDAILPQVGQCIRVQPIPLLETVGDIGNYISTKGGQHLDKQSCCGDTIHIIIAIDRNLFLLCDGLPDTIDGNLHVSHLEGIRIEVRLRSEKSLRFRYSGISTVK